MNAFNTFIYKIAFLLRKNLSIYLSIYGHVNAS